MCACIMIPTISNHVFAYNDSVNKKMFTFYIEDTAYVTQEGWDWADWILSYGISAGDNGIAWIGYDTHPNMKHGYILLG